MMSKVGKILIGIMIFILGITIGITINASANIFINSNDVEYKTDANVKEALDELYNVAENTSCGVDADFYGVRRALNSSSSLWERIGASIGLEANAQIGTTSVNNDFDNIYPWSDIKSYNYDTGSNSITAWYGESDFTFTPTGNVEVLTYIPEFYYRREQRGGYEYIYITKEEKRGYTKSEAFSVGRYTMSGDSTRVHSRSGVAPLTNHTITEFRQYARNLGKDENDNYYFGQLDYHYFIIQLLYLVEYADYNSQAILGQGNTNNSGGSLTSGGCNTLGMKSGTLNNDGKHSVIYRGIEDIFGNIWQFVDGINIRDHQVYISYTPSNYQIETVDYYNKIGYVISNRDGFVSKLGYDSKYQLVAFPTESSDIAVIPDYYGGQNPSDRIPLVGGAWSDGSRCGLWYWTVNTLPTYTSEYAGARLLKY